MHSNMTFSKLSGSTKGSPNKELMQCFKAQLFSLAGVFCSLSLIKLKPRQSTWKKEVIYTRSDHKSALHASKLLERWKSEETRSEMWSDSSHVRRARAQAGVLIGNFGSSTSSFHTVDKGRSPRSLHDRGSHCQAHLASLSCLLPGMPRNKTPSCWGNTA